MLLLRVLFMLINYSFIPIESKADTFKIFIAGARFDLSIIAWVLTPMLLLFIINNFSKKRWLSRIENVIYHIGMLLIILSSLIDVFYYSFNLRRSTLENFRMMQDTNGNISSIILQQPGFVISLVLFVILYFILFRKLINRKEYNVSNGWVILFLGLNILAIRGLNTAILSPLSVPLYTGAQYTPYVSNSPQTLLFSFISSRRSNRFESLKERNYFSQTESEKRYPYIHELKGSGLQKRNVVIFILESFSRSYLEKGNSLKAHTPFLDSIMSNSLVCTNAFANGSISLNGIQNILSGIPTIESASLLSSPYYANHIEAMPALLKRNGYETMFFHGFKEDLFGFERLTKKFGVTHYYSENDLQVLRKDRCIWGIHDGPYFQFAANTLTAKKEPFCATIFNISSHHPYNIPVTFKKTISSQTDVQNAVTYVDDCLKEFFMNARKQSWYENTLFVFTADHWNKEDATNAEKSGLNRHEIPLFFYAPYDSNLKGTYSYVIDQNSIYPSVLDLLGYNGKLCSFGKSIKDTTDRAISFMYQHPHILEVVTDKLAVQFDKTSDKIIEIENYKNLPQVDSLLILNTTDRLKAFIQNYSHAQRLNRLYSNDFKSYK